MPHPFLRRATMRWFLCLGACFVLLAGGLIFGESESTIPALLPVGLVAAFGVSAIVGVRVIERLLADDPPADFDAAIAGIGTRSLIQWVMAVAPSGLALALAISTGPAWVGIVGLVFSLAALLPASPSISRFARIEHTWRQQGCQVDLVARLSSAE